MLLWADAKCGASDQYVREAEAGFSFYFSPGTADAHGHPHLTTAIWLQPLFVTPEDYFNIPARAHTCTRRHVSNSKLPPGTIPKKTTAAELQSGVGPV